MGLSGYGDIATGLGQLNSRLWRKLPFAKRYLQRHSQFGEGSPAPRWSDVSRGLRTDFRLFLNRVDVVVFVERPFPNGMVEAAKAMKKRVVCIPMCEWTPASLPWLRHVDLFIAPTNQCQEWMTSLGHGAKTVRLQCPLDIDEFPFCERTSANRVAYLDGRGGGNERKGWRTVKAVLEQRPVLVEVRSQRNLPGAMPAAACPADLYRDVDCVLMPGRYDGLGLTLLEAMASGCPVLATDCPPYQEFLRAAYGAASAGMLLPVAGTEQVRVWSHTWTAANPDPSGTIAAVDRLKSMIVDEIAALSRAGRRYIEREHGEAAWTKLWEAITGV